MLQTLFYIPSHIAGWPLFGMGLLLAAWTLLSVVVLAWLAWRQGVNADALSYVPVLLIVAAVIVWVLPVLCKGGGLPIRGYGVMMLSAVAVGTALAAYRVRSVGQNPEMIFSLALWLFVPGIFCARAFYVTEYWSTQYWPIYEQRGLAALIGSVVNLTEGGLVVYGSLFGAVLGLLLFVRKYGLPLLALCDLIIPSLVLGLALGRVGCLLNGCCFGGPCDHDWALTFPPGSPPYINQLVYGQLAGFTLPLQDEAEPIVQAVEPHSPAAHAGLKPQQRITKIDAHEVHSVGDARWALVEQFEPGKALRMQLDNGSVITISAADIPRRSLPVHPTQLYSSINALVLCLLLLAYDPFRRRDGELTALALTLYPISRFLIEIIRTDESNIFGTGLTISQNVSLAILVVAAGLWIYILRRPPGKAFEPKAI